MANQVNPGESFASFYVDEEEKIKSEQIIIP